MKWYLYLMWACSLVIKGDSYIFHILIIVTKEAMIVLIFLVLKQGE